MKNKLIVLTTIVLLCLFSTLLKAQVSSSLIEKLERVTKEKEPEWTLDRKLPMDPILVLRWSSGEDRVFMSITLAKSADKAREIYESSVAGTDKDLGTKATKTTLPNLGTANQLWTPDAEDEAARLEFRQGKVAVLLFAPTVDVAKRFAGYVANLLPSESTKTKPAELKPPVWKEHSSAEGRFSLLFPGEVTVEDQVIEPAPGVQLKLRVHQAKTPVECSVMYFDYPMPLNDPEAARDVLDKGAKGGVAAVNSELLELKEITLDGHPGRYLKERMPGGEIMRVKMILVGQRLYQVAITTPGEEGASSKDLKTYQEMSDKFLNSFKVANSEERRQTARIN